MADAVDSGGDPCDGGSSRLDTKEGVLPDKTELRSPRGEVSSRTILHPAALRYSAGSILIDGWFKCWRKIFRTATFRSLPSGDHRWAGLALIALSQIGEQEITCTKCGKQWSLVRGEVHATLTEIAELSCTTRDVVRTTIRRLSRSRFLSVRDACHYARIYTINNYAEYQDNVSEAHGWPTAAPRLPHGCPTQYKKSKKRKKGKKDQAPPETAPSQILLGAGQAAEAADLLAEIANSTAAGDAHALSLLVEHEMAGDWDRLLRLLRWLASSHPDARFWAPHVSGAEYLRWPDKPRSKRKNWERLEAVMQARRPARGVSTGGDLIPEVTGDDW